MAPSITYGAVTPSTRSAPTSVSVFQWPCRHLRDEALAHRGATVETRHFRRHCGLVDEDETRGFQRGLLGSQLLARGRDVRPVLFGRVQDFF
jgi:hypothetical protein